MKSHSPFLIVLACLALTVSAFAQSQTGTITGVVVDVQEAVVPGARITVVSMGTAVTYTAESSAIGTFTVAGLPPGNYRVTVETQGFRTWESVVRVISAQTANIRAAMEVGLITEVITVEAGGEIIETTTAELQTNVDRKQILDLPLTTRNPMELVGLQAGVTGRSAGSSVRNSVFNGLRGRTNNITQDGINVQDNFVRTGGFFAISAPTVENTGEFSISSQNIGAADGAGVGQVRITTPRGSSEYHGSLFYFHRNDAFNANDWFNNATPPGTPKERLRQHRFGGRAGGPVPWTGDRTFFFFRYEGFRENASATRNRTVFTQDARNGLFSYVAGSAGVHPETGVAFNSGDTVTVNLLNSVISRSALGQNAFTMGLVNATPLPNNDDLGDGLNTRGARFNVAGTSENDRYTIRVDHKAFESDTWGTHWVEFVWNFTQFDTNPDLFNSLDAPFPEGVATSCIDGMCINSTQTSERKVLSTAIHSTLSPTLFNEARFGFQRAPVGFLRESDFPRGFRVNFPLITDPELDFLDQGRQTPVYTFLDNLTWVRGSHTWKTGINVTSSSGISFNDGGIIPSVTFGANVANSFPFGSAQLPGISSTDRNRARSLWAVQVGHLGSISQTLNANLDQGFAPGLSNDLFLRERALNVYVQDSWRMTPTFTLNYGFRYELIQPVDIVNKRALQVIGQTDGLFVSGDLFDIDPSITFNDFLTGAVPGPQLVPAGTSNGNPFWNTDYNNFAPFAGIAWSFLPRTVIRTGLSISYVRDGFTLVSQPVGSNDGLQSGFSDTTPTGVLSPSTNFNFTATPLVLPVDQITNYINSGTGSGLFTFDKNLRTPYVVQWSFGIQRELTSSMGVEVRYVGNHAVKQYRGIDFTQVDLLANGMLDSFKLAQQNQSCNVANGRGSRFDNLGFSCSVAMPLLEAITANNQFFFFRTSTFTNSVSQARAGQFVHDLQRFCTFFFFISDGSRCSGLATMPANFFRGNPFTTFADAIGNGSRSQYHGLQMEVRRRLSSGLMFQANYTFGKVLTDSSGTGQNTFDPVLDLRQADYDKRRASFDITHTLNFNGIWEIPLGSGRAYLSEGPLGKFLEGWQIGGIWTWRSGENFGIFSNRGTLNRNGRSSSRNAAALTGSLTGRDVCNLTGAFRQGDGVFFLDQSIIDQSTGRADSSVLGHPGAGELGEQFLRSGCNGPSVFNVDMNFVKRTSFTETVNVEFRFEIFNIFNTPRFNIGSTASITSTNFGRITSTFSEREIQFNLRLNF